MRSPILLALPAITILTAGCWAHSAEVTGHLPTPGTDLITGSDIEAVGGSTALDGVRLVIRPPSATGRAPWGFQQRRGDPPVAYLDGVRLSDIRTLDQLHYTSVETIQFLDAATATLRYGTGHFGGALVVTTHKGR